MEKGAISEQIFAIKIWKIVLKKISNWVTFTPKNKIFCFCCHCNKISVAWFLLWFLIFIFNFSRKLRSLFWLKFYWFRIFTLAFIIIRIKIIKCLISYHIGWRRWAIEAAKSLNEIQLMNRFSLIIHIWGIQIWGLLLFLIWIGLQAICLASLV